MSTPSAPPPRPTSAGTAVVQCLIAYASSSSPSGDVVGVLLAVVAALSFAIGVLTQKRLLSGFEALELTFWYTLVGWAACLPWLVPAVAEYRDASLDTLGWVLYLGVFPSAIAFVGGALCIAGVLVARRRPRPAVQPEPEPEAVRTR